MATDEATQSGLPSCDWTPRGTGAVVPAAAPCAHPPPQGVQTDLGKSLLVLETPILVEILSFIWRWRRLPAPSHQEQHWGGGGPGETSGAYPLMVYTLSGTQLKDTEESPLPVKRCWVGGWLKDARRIAHPVERYSVGGLDWEKKIKEYPGLS